MKLDKLGVWFFCDAMSATDAAAFARRVESLGYSALWIPEATGREVLASSSWLLAATERLVVATGIANIYARDAMTMAAGAKTLKMKFGHHGANHPVQDLRNNRVLITSQNHGFAVDEDSLPESVEVTHRSLFDGSVQGIAHRSAPAFSFQGHPEASPGPHDLLPLFEQFMELMR